MQSKSCAGEWENAKMHSTGVKKKENKRTYKEKKLGVDREIMIGIMRV